MKLLLAAVLPMTAVQAGTTASANIHGCVSFSTDLHYPMQVNITTGVSGTQCMNQSGSDGSFTVTKGGVTCYSMGLVQNKVWDTGSDNCASYAVESIWNVAYVTNTSLHGSTSSLWTANYHLDLRHEMHLTGQDPGTCICNVPLQCTKNQQIWLPDADPPTLYLIFFPLGYDSSTPLIEESDILSQVTITGTQTETVTESHGSTVTQYVIGETREDRDPWQEQIP